MSIRQAKDKQGRPVKGKWVIVVEKPRDYLTGKRRQHSETFTGTEKMAIRREVELEAEYGSGDATASFSIRYLALEMWLPWCRDYRGCTERTISGYKYILDAVVLPAIGDIKVDELRASHIESCLTQRTAPYAKKVFAVIRAMVRYAVRKGLINNNPLLRVEMPRVRSQKKEQRVYSLEQVAEIYALIKEQCPWWSALWVMGAFAGLRPEESTALNEPPLDWDGYVEVERSYAFNGEKYILSDVLKTATSRRNDYPLVGDQLAFIMGITSGNTDVPLAINPRTYKRANRENFYRAYKRWCINNCVEFIPPKDLRATYATALARYNSSGTIARLLGHSDKGRLAEVHYIRQDRQKNAKISAEMSEYISSISD